MEDLVKEACDFRTSLQEFGCITFSCGGKVRAVSTTVAVRCHGSLVELRSVLSLSGPLPWILNSVCEEDVRSLDVCTTLIKQSVLSLWQNREVELREHFLAAVSPVLLVHHLGAHCVLVTNSLEESEFSAVLVRPLADPALRVDVGALGELRCIGFIGVDKV